MKMCKILLLGLLALSLAACATDPNAIYPDAGSGNTLGDFFVQDPADPSTPGPTVNVNIDYPGYASFGSYKTPNGLVTLAASNQSQIPYAVQGAVSDKLTDLGFKLPEDILSIGSRTLNITISSLTFSYQGSNIVASCVINLQAAAGTFDHMSKTYRNTVTISNNPAASQSQVIQAVGQALNNTLGQMMSDQSLISFIS
ncbi:MAG: hypothetical protein K0R66_636 [Gammaproteobacteria bacterium]|jgi:uncharacterized lipoprotein YajG|nr:hypothetical protein [Gammaproteobacteria bacterium]